MHAFSIFKYEKYVSYSCLRKGLVYCCSLFDWQHEMATVLSHVDIDLSYLTEPEQDQIQAVVKRDELLRQQLLERIELVSFITTFNVILLRLQYTLFTLCLYSRDAVLASNIDV